MISIFDSHTHINSHEFDDDIPDVIDRAKALNVDSMLVLGYDGESADKMVKLINQYPNIYGAVGIHPEDAAKYDDFEDVKTNHDEELPQDGKTYKESPQNYRGVGIDKINIFRLHERSAFCTFHDKEINDCG